MTHLVWTYDLRTASAAGLPMAVMAAQTMYDPRRRAAARSQVHKQ